MDLTNFHGPPAAPPRVPGFVARTLLGFGAHGEVWLADDLSTGGSVALKIGRRAMHDPMVPTGVPPDRPASPVAGSEQETALLCRIDHPHIVRLQRVVQLGGADLALVLDLASGGSLASLVAARGTFDPGEVTTLLIPLAGALEHLHRSGVVHGDIAPGNVLFTAQGRPQLGDLGVARMLGTRAADTWATPGFTDPLMTAGNGPVDARAADLWSLAAVGWFALTGRPPEPDAVAARRLAGQTPVLTELLADCLSTDPRRRPDLDEVADRAWQAAHPTPIRLIPARDPVGVEVGLPPLSDLVTRRVVGSDAVTPEGLRSGDVHTVPAAAVRPSAERNAVRSSWLGGRRQKAGDRGRKGRLGATTRARRVGAVVATACILATGLGAILMIGVVPTVNLVGSHENAVARPVPSSSDPTGVGSVGLEGELSRALAEIARSRAEAFAYASPAALKRADEPDSPAYQADLALVQRLRARGVRLEGVRYEITGVHVLQRRADEVEVAAAVTTSGHRQIGATSGTQIQVAEDGPRPLVFTVVPATATATGPAGWRIQSFRADS
jgi:eukaryotic-like serine/threonine-protein kinase